MKGKFSISTKLLPLFTILICFSTLPAFAQDNCAAQLEKELADLNKVQEVIQENNNFLTILGTSDKTEVIKTVSRITTIHSRTSATGCDFSTYPIAVVNSELKPIKAKTAKSLTNADLAKLLYKHVYALSPLQIDENIKGYTRLAELIPHNTYYASRIKHYQERADLQKDRSEFISKCLKEAAKDSSIIDLKVNRDVYLFITKDSDSQKTVSEFIAKVAKSTPKPKKELCLFFYDSNLNRQGESCPAEYQKNLGNTEEALLMNYVQSIPGYEIDLNINGYKALKKLNPTSTLYTTKLNSYESKSRGLDSFIKVKASSGNRLFIKDNVKGSTLFVTLNSKAVEGKSQSAVNSFYDVLNSYYSYSGSPYPRCVIKSSAGTTLGKIQCDKNGRCNFTH